MSSRPPTSDSAAGSPATNRSALRIGAVSYLNSKPLVQGLSEAVPEAHVSLDLPSRLADDLAAGKLDVALVPIVEYLRQPEFRLISDACVACRGPVLSVKLYFRRPPGEVRLLALDEGSRTSAALAQVLLWNLHGTAPELTPLEIGATAEQADADAVLLIGDRAMQPPREEFCEVWDLGDRWCRWAELPFVFAAWVARPRLPVDAVELAGTFQAVRDRGVRNIEAIASTYAPSLNITTAYARDYLTHNLHFSLGTSEQRAIEQFAELCRKQQLVGSTLPSFSVQTAYP